MPLYSFECQKCKIVKDEFFHIADCPESIPCECGGQAKKIITAGYGGIQTDNDVIWLPSAIKTLQRENERPIETRTEYNKYLKENNLVCKG